MNVISRRGLLCGTALTLVGACTAGNVALTEQIVSDVNSIAAGLSGVLPVLAAVKGVPADAIAKVQSIMAQVLEAANAIGQTTSQSAALPALQQFGALTGQVITLVTPFLGLLPPPWGTVVLAAQVLLPVVLSAVGLLQQQRGIAPSAGGMTPAQARLILRSVGR